VRLPNYSPHPRIKRQGPPAFTPREPDAVPTKPYKARPNGNGSFPPKFRTSDLATSDPSPDKRRQLIRGEHSRVSVRCRCQVLIRSKPSDAEIDNRKSSCHVDANSHNRRNASAALSRVKAKDFVHQSASDPIDPTVTGKASVLSQQPVKPHQLRHFFSGKRQSRTSEHGEGSCRQVWLVSTVWAQQCRSSRLSRCHFAVFLKQRIGVVSTPLTTMLLGQERTAPRRGRPKAGFPSIALRAFQVGPKEIAPSHNITTMQREHSAFVKAALPHRQHESARYRDSLTAIPSAFC